MNDEIKKADEIARALRTECSDCSERNCCNHGNNPVKYCPVIDAADLIDSLAAQLAESERREKADAELIRKIYFATDEDLCDCCRKIVRMIEAWWNDDEKGEAE